METTIQEYDLMVRQLKEINKRVERGAALMDRYRTEWFNEEVLNLQIFSISSGRSCVIGQAVRPEDVNPLYHRNSEYPLGYSAKVNWMEETYDGVPKGMIFEVYYGFSLTHHGDVIDLIWQRWHWDELQRAWQVHINARRLAKEILAVTE